MNYPGLDFDREELSAAMQQGYDELIGFVTQPPFQEMYREMMALPAEDRPRFVEGVIVNDEAREKRGVVVPADILVVTSAFGDRRPTLFAVKKYLPRKFHGAWENVNWTFCNEYDDDDLSRDPEDSWRPPLPIDIQNEVMSSGGELNSVPDELGINYDHFVNTRKAEN